MIRIHYVKSPACFSSTPVSPEMDEILRDFRMGEIPNSINPETLGESHDMVYTIQLGHYKDMEINDLEVIFHNFQGEFMQDLIRAALQANGASHTSLSVGDIVEDGEGKLWLCSPATWTLVYTPAKARP